MVQTSGAGDISQKVTDFPAAPNDIYLRKIRPYRESGYISQASVPQKRITVSVSGTKGLNRELDASKITEEAVGTEVRGLPDCWLKSHITIPMTQSGNHRCLQTMDLEMYQWDI